LVARFVSVRNARCCSVSTKTWLACAFGQQACRQGFSVLYVRVARLFEELKIAHGDSSFSRRLAQLAKTDVLLLDDWDLQDLDQNARNDLLEVIDDRVGTRSTIITSQLPLEHWHAWLQDPTLADAILDRLVHQAHKLPLKGESMRKKQKNEHTIACSRTLPLQSMHHAAPPYSLFDLTETSVQLPRNLHSSMGNRKSSPVQDKNSVMRSKSPFPVSTAGLRGHLL
jgi:hypothetical protein